MKPFGMFGAWLVRIYQWTLSPVIHFLAGPASGCRFYPTCSDYAITALRRFGFMRGSWLAFHRIIRCSPLSTGGDDPVPDRWQGFRKCACHHQTKITIEPSGEKNQAAGFDDTHNTLNG